MNKNTLNAVLRFSLGLLNLLFIINSGLQRLPGVNKRQWIMRINIIIVLITGCFLQVSATSLAQTVTLHVRNGTLKSVLQKVREQTGYDFLYDARTIRQAMPVNADISQMKLADALDLLLKDQKLQYTINNRVIVIEKHNPSFLEKLTGVLAAIDVNARVLDEKGQPLLGATIQVKTKNILSTSDKDGSFTIKNIDKKDIVSISYVGYNTVNIAAGDIKETIKMEPFSAKLNEVTVTTAYGIERNKKELGYSVAKVSGEQLNRANDGNILNGLQGKVSGLNITTQSSSMSPQMRILIRGIRSFGETSNNQPLFVFNGAPLSFGSDGDAGQAAVEFINNLNPADVEEVTVLKGANGTALYGPEGVNGVIIITTKKVKSGTMTVNARVNQAYQVMDFRQLDQQREFGLGNESSLFGGKATTSWGPAYDGKPVAIGYPDINGKYQTVPYTPNFDNHKFFNVATTNRTTVSLAQGDQTSSFYLGLGHVDQTGLLPDDKQNQTTLLYNAGKKMGKAFDVQINLNYAKTNSDRGQDVTSEILNTPAFIPLLSYKDYQNSYWGMADNYWSGQNSYAKLGLNRTKQTDNAFSSSLTFNIKALPWLNIKDVVGLNYLGRSKKINISPTYYSNFARVDALKKNDIQPQTTDYLGSILGVNNDLLLTAVKQTGDFIFRVNTGASIRDNYQKQLQTKATLVIPVFNDIYYRSDYGIGADEVTIQTRSISAFASTSLGYKDQIFLELTGRNEWDSKRAKAARGKDFYFGANTSIVLKDMVPFLKSQEWLSTFRLRLSATRTANMNILPDQSERILLLSLGYPYTNTTGQSVLGYGLSTNPNPLIKPEKIFSQEYGTEIGLFNNRVRFDAAYYHQINDGVIMKVGVPVLSGYPDLDNAGELRNTGWEFDLNLNPLVNFSDDLNISVQGRFSINNNKVLRLSAIYDGVFTEREPGGAIYYARTGYPAFEFSSVDFIRDPEGHVIVDGSTGLPTQDLQNPKPVGQTLPVYQGGASININYKRFSLSTQVDYSSGNQHRFSTLSIANGTSSFTLLNNRQAFIYPNSVIQDKPGHFIPNTSVPVSNTGSDLFGRIAGADINGLVNASYWKVREVSLHYELPFKTSWVKRADLSVYARNLFSFYPRSNIYGDPEGSNGPGLQTVLQVPGQRIQSQVNNLTGGTSEANTGPGTVLYGFTLGLTF
jgi:TonB-linked SusC/RagA family outer membrane protein